MELNREAHVEDMKAVARYVSKHKRVWYGDLARETQLPSERMENAVSSLESDKRVKTTRQRQTGRPFDFIEPTSRLEEWLREQGEN